MTDINILLAGALVALGVYTTYLHMVVSRLRYALDRTTAFLYDHIKPIIVFREDGDEDS